MKKAFIFSAIASLLFCSSWATEQTASNVKVWRKSYTRYRFAVDAPRSYHFCMQLSEIQLLDANGSRISSGYTLNWDSVTKSSDNWIYPDNESPDLAADGKLDTKWLDWRAGLKESAATRAAAWLEFCFEDPTMIYGYRWYTANDAVERDPVAWTLSAFDDNDGTWHVLEKVTGYDPTQERKTLAYEYFLESTEWVNENSGKSDETGSWTRDVAYGADGKADIIGDNAFSPYLASTGNVVTVEVKTVLKGVELDVAGNQESDVQAAVCLSTNGVFQVWAGTGSAGVSPAWVEVAADGVTPVSGKEYTLRFMVNYTSNRYSVDVKVADEWKSLVGVQSSSSRKEDSNSTLQLNTPTPTSSFPLACVTNRVAEVSFSGATRFTSLFGESVAVEGFARNEEVVLDNVSVILSAAQAAWLNGCSGDKAEVADALTHVPSAEIFNDAYLLNFNITEGEFDYSFEITDIKVLPDCVKVMVSLVRDGEINGPINGTLKFYGAETLAAFKSGTATPLVSKTLVDGDFSDGETATATFDKDCNVFFDAKIEEK